MIETFVNVSWNIINAVMNNLVTNKDGIKISHEQESDDKVEDSSDQSQFKGIFMRYLMYFYQNVVLELKDVERYFDIKSQIIAFVNKQLNAVYANCMNPSCFGEFSAVWNATWTMSKNAGVAEISAIDAWNWAFVLQ